jgi:hypothetical protein
MSLDGIAQPLQVLPDFLLQPGRLRELLGQLPGETLHLLVERLAVVFDLLRADVSAGRQDVTMPANVIGTRSVAPLGERL